VYIGQQRKSCEDVGIEYEVRQFPETITQKELLAAIHGLNKEKAVTGVIMMMPMPKGIDARQLQVRISPAKDVEGMHPANMGRLVYGEMGVCPCTARGALELFLSSGETLKGKEIVIVGHSEIVGKPLALMMLASQMESATPTVCHIATKDLAFHTKRADVLFVAVGKAGLIKGDMVKQGAIVIDIGINRVPMLDAAGKPVLNEKGKPKQKIVGDVDFDGAKERASLISPVPGGVGPMTTAMLIRNTVQCAQLAAAGK
jgi:methylenetetrahydrofolate dehydrogenase (NADP+)/methenyltetrahydrofolate cyclohydrolase